MSSTILVIGSTGNTGKNVVRTLSELVKGKDLRIVGLTRSAGSPAAQSLAKLPSVEMEEQDWTEIDADWLKKRNVVKVFVAAFNDPNQFTEESALYVTLLEAGVKYVVRVSTMQKFIFAASPIYYGRAHYALEQMLSQSDFKALQWTSLQPNYFSSMFVAGAAAWIKEFRKTGKQTPLRIVSDESGSAAMIDPDDVGAIGAHLLALDDATPHAGARYVLNGPADVTGADITKAVEKIVGSKVETVKYRDTDLFQLSRMPNKIARSMHAGLEYLWRGEASLAGTPTSKEVFDIAEPKRTIEDTLKALTAE